VSSFRRGLRNRNPLVLVAALALLVPALLAIQDCFASGARTAVAARHRLRRKPYEAQAFDARKALPDSQKRELVRQWLARCYPVLKKVRAFDAAMLDGLVTERKARGLDVVVEPPWDRQIVGDAFAEALHDDGPIRTTR
jgi:hypothetical protein